MKPCEWHEDILEQPDLCPGEDCDFRSLDYEKDAILERLKEESEKVQEMRDDLAEGDFSNLSSRDLIGVEDTMKEIADISRGMQIMVDRLVEDFDMSEKEVKDEIDIENLGMKKKAKLAYKLATMRKSRGKKKDED